MSATSAFKVFKKEFSRLTNLYNLRDWTVIFQHTQIGNGGAKIDIEYAERFAVVHLDKEIMDDTEALECARHEATHLFTARLEDLANKRCLPEGLIFDEVERLAQIMQRLEVREAV